MNEPPYSIFSEAPLPTSNESTEKTTLRPEDDYPLGTRFRDFMNVFQATLRVLPEFDQTKFTNNCYN